MRFTALALITCSLVLQQLPLAAKDEKAAPAQESEIKPPFNLMWNESAERLEAKIKAAKLEIIERRVVEGRDALTVTGFRKPDPKDPKAPKPPELKRVIFYSSEQQLVEVELQYEQDGWTEEDYGKCLGEKRRLLERLYGASQQLVRNTAPTPDGQATQTLVGYKWNKNNVAVEIIYFAAAAREPLQTYRTLSLHYKLQTAPR